MNLLHQLHRHAAERPDQLAIRECCSGRTLTWRQLEQAVMNFADQLLTEEDKTTTYLLRCGNRLEFHVAFLACFAANHVVFPVSHDIAELELHHATLRSGASGLIEDDLRIQPLTSTGSAAQEPALLLQSSGTTGLPKIVCRPTPTVDASARQIVESIGLNFDDHILMCVPLSHSYGLEHGLLAAIDAGASVHLAHGFNVGVIGNELAHSGITILPAVPAVFEMLAHFDDLPTTFPYLRLAYSAGGPLPINVNAAFYKRFCLRIGQVYGASEIGSVTFAGPRDGRFDPSSVGRAMPHVELKLDADNQLLVRAPSMMSGYLNEATPFTSDRYFPTGDLARITDDGQLTLTGRLKLLIDIGGRKVNPLEVEQALTQHSSVAECVVVSVQQTETLQRLKALIIPAPDKCPPSPEELRHFLKDRLSPYKIPRLFECRTSFPRSSAGKILRQLLEKS
jgi:acyl-CoA synthetase (AMP-forming)/AMP-acid ligase II